MVGDRVASPHGLSPCHMSHFMNCEFRQIDAFPRSEFPSDLHFFRRAVTPIHTFQSFSAGECRLSSMRFAKCSYFLEGTRGQLANSAQSSPIYFGRLRTVRHYQRFYLLLLFFPPFLPFLPALPLPLTPLHSYSHNNPNVSASDVPSFRSRSACGLRHPSPRSCSAKNTHGVGCLALRRPGLRVGYFSVVASGLLSRQ
jgi:hypothetical protein